MSEEESRASKTVLALIDHFNRENISYAIARNYESYPNFNRDLDIYFFDSVVKVKEILREVAKEQEWDTVTYCDHWSKSKIISHNIDVFKFYRESSFDFLQVDLFYSFLIWGSPLISSEQIIEQRELIKPWKFYRINVSCENILRLFQINKLLSNANQEGKISRYRKRTIDYYRCSGEAMVCYGRDLGLSFIKKALMALEIKNYSVFRRIMFAQKVVYSLKRMFNNPVHFAAHLFYRTVDYYRLFYTCPCGFLLKVYVDEFDKKIEFMRLMDDIVSSGIIRCWMEKKSLISYNYRERGIMERGGVLVQWEDELGKEDIYLSFDLSYMDCFNYVLKQLIRKHELIYG